MKPNEYFSKRVEISENGCWIWIMSKMYNGYGACKKKSAHIRSYEQHIGKIPKYKILRHICKYKLCCNPEHLLIGTQRDNYYDIPLEKRKEMHRKTGETIKRTGVLKGCIPWNKGKKQSKEFSIKMKNIRLNEIKIPCEYCGKLLQKSNYNQHLKIHK